MNGERVGTLIANLGCIAAVGGAYVTWGTGGGLFAAAVYLLILGAATQEKSKEVEDDDAA